VITLDQARRIAGAALVHARSRSLPPMTVTDGGHTSAGPDREHADARA
jgi:hypothetical protein